MPSKDTSRTYGFMLRDVLLKLNISDEQFTKLCGRGYRWAYRMLRSENSPSWENAVHLSRVLGVPVGVFADNDPARLAWFQSADPVATTVCPPPPKPKPKPRTSGPRPKPGRKKKKVVV